MESKFYDTLIRIEVKQQQLLADVSEMKAKMSDLPCKTNSLKINTIQKIVYGAVLIVLVAFMKKLAYTP